MLRTQVVCILPKRERREPCVAPTLATDYYYSMGLQWLGLRHKQGGDKSRGRVDFWQAFLVASSGECASHLALHQFLIRNLIRRR